MTLFGYGKTTASIAKKFGHCNGEENFENFKLNNLKKSNQCNTI